MSRHFRRALTLAAAISGFVAMFPGAYGQVIPSGIVTPQQIPPAAQQIPAAAQPITQAQNSIDSLRQSYELAANDQILIHAPDTEELNDRPFRIDDDGTVTLPLVGVVKAAGMNLQQFEDDMRNRLKRFVLNPIISITVTQFRTAPVFFIGEFLKPGVYSLQGRHTLVEMLTTVGGLQPTASRRIKVTRKDESGSIPLAGVVPDPEMKTNSVEITLSALSEINPAEDIVLQPYDVISVDRAEQVYTQGAIGKVGGFDVGVKDSIPVLQLLSMAGGMAADADGAKARILRPVLSTNRRAEIPLDLNKILATEGTDYPLLPGDILYIPRQKTHSAALSRLGTVAVSVIPSVLIGLLINGRL